MKTHIIELTDEEYAALSAMVEKGWDYLMDCDYFYGAEEEKPAYEASLEKVYHSRTLEKNEPDT